MVRKDDVQNGAAQVARDRFRSFMVRFIESQVHEGTEDMENKRKRAACRRTWTTRLDRMTYDEVLAEFERRDGYETLEVNGYWKEAYKGIMKDAI